MVELGDRCGAATETFIDMPLPILRSRLGLRRSRCDAFCLPLSVRSRRESAESG